MAITIKNTKDIKQKKLKIISWGGTGTGKTYALRTLPKYINPFIVEAEGGLLSVTQGENPRTFDYYEMKKENVLQQCTELLKFIVADTKYNLIFVDSITEIFDNILLEIKPRHTSKENFKMWGEYKDVVTLFAKTFRDIDKHVIFTCGEKVEYNKDEIKSFDLLLQGSISDNIAYYFDEVFYNFVNNQGKHKMLTQKQNNVLAKDRSGQLAIYEDPDYSVIFEKILGKQEN